MSNIDAPTLKPGKGRLDAAGSFERLAAIESSECELLSLERGVGRALR
jgi:hypothetical protein